MLSLVITRGVGGGPPNALATCRQEGPPNTIPIVGRLIIIITIIIEPLGKRIAVACVRKVLRFHENIIIIITIIIEPFGERIAVACVRKVLRFHENIIIIIIIIKKTHTDESLDL